MSLSSSIPLTQAVTSGDESAVSALVAAGADVNETTSGGQTPLILAVIFGHTKVVRLLVEAGADPYVRDNLGLDAIEWAQRRGLREALSILTNGVKSATPPKKIIVDIQEPEESVPAAPPPASQEREAIADAEKSRRWVSGLKQRLDELEGRKLNRNEPRQSHREPAPIEQSPPSTTVVPKQVPVVETKPAPVAAPAEPVATKEPPRPTGRILTAPPENDVPAPKRKRCPKCNEIYNGELVSYCPHHVVPLIDVDQPIMPEPPKANRALFWVMVAVTLIGSIVVGSLITAYMYKSNQAAARSAAPQQSNIQKGVPEVGGDLAGKAVALPEAQCPLVGPPVSGIVTVRVTVDRKGQVHLARASGGDWLMRGAATEAAMKSTFAPEKLRSRETEGTIIYTFKP